MKHCEDCRYWVRVDTEHFGRCRNQKIAFDVSMHGPAVDGLAYWDSDGYGATVYMGNEFGCVHWDAQAAEFVGYTDEGLVAILKANVGLSGLSNYGRAVNEELARRAEMHHG